MARHLDVTAFGSNYLRRVAERIRHDLDPAALPAGDSELLFDLYAVLALSVGEAVTEADVHNAWVAWMMTVDPTHESLVPFSDLDAETAAADSPFVDAIRAVAHDLAHERLGRDEAP